MEARIVALDVGDKKIGIALTDPLGYTVQPLGTLLRTSFRKDCDKLLNMLADYTIREFVIGLPLGHNGEETPQSRKVRFFAEGLDKHMTDTKKWVPIILWDESFTSREAEDFLLAQDLSRKKRKGAIDQLAATLILESYLRGHDSTHP